MEKGWKPGVPFHVLPSLLRDPSDFIFDAKKVCNFQEFLGYGRFGEFATFYGQMAGG